MNKPRIPLRRDVSDAATALANEALDRAFHAGAGLSDDLKEMIACGRLYELTYQAGKLINEYFDKEQQP